MASEEGFTLIELLVVMIILGILVAIAVPAYLSLTGKAKTAAAEANVRSAIPAAETWYQDSSNNTNPNTYTSLSFAKLNTEAPGIATTVKAGVFNSGAAYCIEDTENSISYHYVGGDPGSTTVTGGAGKILSGLCSSAVASITVS